MQAAPATRACLNRQAAGLLRPIKASHQANREICRMRTDDRLDGQLDSATGFQGLWLLSLAEPVVGNGISAGADTFTFKAGDRATYVPVAAS